MKICPHCGASLRDDARFCLRCMTPLNTKRVVPTPKHLPIRWLSATAAVFVLCGLLWAGWRFWPRGGNPTLPTAVTPTPVSTTVTESAAATTTFTFAWESAPVLVPLFTSVSVLPPTSDTATTTATTTHTTVPPTTTASATLPPSMSTSASTSTSTTTMTKKTTTTTKPVKKYPAEWDTVYRSTTEDDLPIEEVTWTYKVSREFIHITHYDDGCGISYGYIERRSTSNFRVPFTECIIITGFDAPTSNGIYRVPAAIDGKVVIGLDMRSKVQGARQFNDKDIAPTVKRIYLPPEIVFVERETIDLCTGLEAMHISSEDIWIEPEALPQKKTQTLYLYSITQCHMSCPSGYSDYAPVLWLYCEYYLCNAFECDCSEDDPHYNGGYNEGYYKGATWQFSSFALWELYGPRF